MLQTPHTAEPSSSRPVSFLGRLFAPPTPAEPVAGTPDEVRANFRYWQNRVLFSSLIGYAMFYVVRKNLSMAMPVMEKDIGVTKAQLGTFLTMHGLIYGVSKFANGYWGDRSNARTFMVVGLIMSGLCNVAFGFSSAVMALGIFWMLNGWFQGMGFPPCARLMTHWFPPQQLATKMSFWNTSHSIGAGLVLILGGYLVAFGWRWCLWGPALIAFASAVFLWFTLRDTPKSVGLPELAETKTAKEDATEHSSSEFKRFIRRQVFGNPYVWIFALANFFVYSMRYAILDWGPTLLHEFKGYELKDAGRITAAFEISGVIGMLSAGWITDKLFQGRSARTCLFCMILASASLFCFWKLPWIASMLSSAGFSISEKSLLLNTAVLCSAGFFIYGPQALVGIAVANLATKKAAATAIGFTGLFGYASTTLSGRGLGVLVDNKGWDVALSYILYAGIIGILLFLMAWRAKANGYEDPARA